MHRHPLTIKLILNDIVECLEEVEDEVVVGGFGVEEPRGREGLHQVKETSACDHGEGLQVWRH